MNAYLILDDGSVFPGIRFGAPQEAVCEMVFGTGMTGYLEMLTDASFAGQGIVMSSPVVGNYGVFTEQGESGRAWPAAMIVRDLTHVIHDERDAEDLDEYLRRQGIAGIREIDTRTLTLTLREKGTMNGMITAGPDYDLETCLQKIHAFRNVNPVARVSRKHISRYPAGAQGRTSRLPGDARPSESMMLMPFTVDPTITTRYKVAVLDYGIKQNIVWNLTQRGCDVTVYPHDTPADVILAEKPDGIMLSNGPGDPEDCVDILPEVRKLFDSGTPVFAICLGHQLIALATGARSRRLKYGHRGINHPVKDLEADRVYITSQNHGYVIIDETIDPSVAKISHVHLNDGSVEGLRYLNRPVRSVQYHPEGAPGPHDSEYLFDQFLDMMDQGRA